MKLAVMFHQRVETYIGGTNEWKRECSSDERYPTEGDTTVASIAVLEQSLQRHADLYDRFTKAYGEVSRRIALQLHNSRLLSTPI